MTIETVDVEQVSNDGELTERIYLLSADEFSKLKVVDRDAALFLLVREMAGSIKALEMRIDEYENKAKAMMTPEGLSEISEKVMGGLMGGGMGGMMGLLR